MGRDDAGGSLGVGWVGGGCGGDAGDGDGRGVGGKNGVLWRDLGELPKELELELWDLWHGLDDEVDGGEVVHGGGWSEAGTDGVGLFLGDAALADILC